MPPENGADQSIIGELDMTQTTVIPILVVLAAFACAVANRIILDIILPIVRSIFNLPLDSSSRCFGRLVPAWYNGNLQCNLPRGHEGICEWTIPRKDSPA